MNFRCLPLGNRFTVCRHTTTSDLSPVTGILRLTIIFIVPCVALFGCFMSCFPTPTVVFNVVTPTQLIDISITFLPLSKLIRADSQQLTAILSLHTPVITTLMHCKGFYHKIQCNFIITGLKGTSCLDFFME